MTSGLAPRPQVGLSDEAGHEHRGGAVVDLGRCADLFDVAGVHDRDAVTHRQRFLLIVGHVDERDADLALDPFELELHDVAQFEVQRAERLVEQQRAGVVDQSPGQGDPLLLATGQLRGLALGEVGQAHGLEEFVDPLADRVLVLLGRPRTVGHVVAHRHVGEQRVMLEDRVDVALVGRRLGHVGAFEPDGPLGGRLEPGDHPQRGGLAAPGRPEHREELALGNGEVRVGDGDVIAEALRDMVDLDDRAALVLGGLGFRHLVYSGCVCAGQGQSSSGASREAVGKPSRIAPTFASDSATNLHIHNRIPCRFWLTSRESAHRGACSTAAGPGVGRHAVVAVVADHDLRS